MKFKVSYRLTLKTVVNFIFDNEQDALDHKKKCLKEGIEAEDNRGNSYYYPAKRINEVIITKTNF